MGPNLKDVRPEFFGEDPENTFRLPNPWKTQVGGSHYKDFAIQPTEFIEKNGLGFLQGCIIKRICRFDKKGKPLEDLEKIKHEVDMLIELRGLDGEKG